MENLEITMTYLDDDFAKDRFRLILKLKDRVCVYLVDKTNQTLKISSDLYIKLWFYRAIKHFKQNINNKEITAFEL